ncbi:MAG: PQQ-binding-like beta-propeller repeat protein [Verrucomicrobiota bacterium]
MKIIPKKIFALTVASFSTLTLFANSDWPQFRGPTGQGHSDAKGVPLHWSETENVKWKRPIPGQGWSSPVILGNQIWMTTALENGKSLRAVCVDRETGKILQNAEVFSIEAPEFKHELNSYASPTPVIEAERVFVHFGTYGTACLSTETGKILWRNQEMKLEHENGPGSSPALLHDQLIIPCDGMDARYLIALSKLTGKPIWKTDRSGEINKPPSFRKAYSTPLVIQVNGREQIVTSAADYVFGYEPETGKEIWRVHYEGYSNVPRPVYGEGLLFICTGFDKPQLWAIRPNGAGDVTQTHVAWKYLKQVPQKPSPILFGEKIYFISDGGIATCLDAKSGKEIWQERLGGEHSASPVCVDGKIYFFSHEGTTVVLEPGETYKPIATNQLGTGFMASAAISGKAFYLRSKTDLYRIEK